MEGGREEGMIRLVGWIGGARAEEHARAWPACGRGQRRGAARRGRCAPCSPGAMAFLSSSLSFRLLLVLGDSWAGAAGRGAEDVCDPRFSGRFLVTDRTSPSSSPACLPACLPSPVLRVRGVAGQRQRPPRPALKGTPPPCASDTVPARN
jgi:hypothetical protein